MTTRLDTMVWQGSDVDATIIERHLSALWTDLCHRAEFRAAVRMHVFNLVVYVRDETTLRLVSDSLRKIPRRLPSRAIILTGDRFDPTSAIDGEIHLTCQGASPSGLPLCHEQVIVRARGRAADHLASVVIPLLIPQLRTYLWWPGQPPFGHRVLHRLLSVVDQFVIDSSEFESPGDGIANLVRLNALQVGINDLNWARLLPWREVITQFFEGPQWAPYAWGIRRIELEFGTGGSGSRTTAGILLLLGWVAAQLGWEPETGLDGLATEDVTLAVLQGERVIPVQVTFREHGKEAAGTVRSLEVVSQPRDMPPARFRVQRTDDARHVRATTTVQDGPSFDRVIALTGRDDIGLLADELEGCGHNAVYDRAIDMAGRIAGREVWLPT